MEKEIDIITQRLKSLRLEVDQNLIWPFLIMTTDLNFDSTKSKKYIIEFSAVVSWYNCPENFERNAYRRNTFTWV